MDSSGDVREFWLHLDEANSWDTLYDYLESCRVTDNPIMVGYATPAEARAMMALGFNPHEFEWIDLYADHKQCQNKNDSCMYGRKFVNGFQIFTKKPKFVKELNAGDDNNKIGGSMADAVGLHLGVCVDTGHKTAMRDLIISNPDSFELKDRKNIMDYCTSDVMPLPYLLLAQYNVIKAKSKMPHDHIVGSMLKRGEFQASIAKMEQVGCPLDYEAAWNLRKNEKMASESLVKDLVENVFPFFVRQRKGKELLGSWTKKYDKFVEYLHTLGEDVFENWPRTEAKAKNHDGNSVKTDEKTLDKYVGYPGINHYKQTTKLISQIKWFKQPDEKKIKLNGDFFDSVGSDHSVRTFLGSYGTQTSRNAPKASRFILAMSAWLRCLIRPPKGKTIIAIDYASQEFAIAAILSGDPDMMAAYRSGDPYLYFAKKAGAVPDSADPKKVKNFKKLLDPLLKKQWPEKTFEHGPSETRIQQLRGFFPKEMEEYDLFESYARQRDLFKSTTLGLQYGMGYVNLSIKLTADMGYLISPAEAKRLIQLHSRTYPRYWKWLKEIMVSYKVNKCYTLWDGWTLFGDNDNELSVKNFPTQGTGGVIMREAVRLCHNIGINLISPLHDALYALADDDKVEWVRDNMAECMLQAVRNVLGDKLDIRLDIDLHSHEDTWIEGKGARFYHKLKKYLKSGETLEDQMETMKNTIYSTEGRVV